jgi:hypothetical protein
MPHEINQMAYVGKEPWHGLGTPLPTNADYDSIVQAADFYTAVERDVFAPPRVAAPSISSGGDSIPGSVTPVS